jgi:DNA-binding NtrC family response regulator
MAAKRTTTSGIRRKRRALVYLVDDEPVLLDLLEFSLRHDGYTLRKFIDPEEALSAFQKARPKPDLLVTDYALGKMNGLELIEKCKRLRPGLKIVMVSGTATAAIADRSPVKVDQFLSKPYEPGTLSEVVKRALALEPQVSA